MYHASSCKAVQSVQTPVRGEPIATATSKKRSPTRGEGATGYAHARSYFDVLDTGPKDDNPERSLCHARHSIEKYNSRCRSFRSRDAERVTARVRSSSGAWDDPSAKLTPSSSDRGAGGGDHGVSGSTRRLKHRLSSTTSGANSPKPRNRRTSASTSHRRLSLRTADQF